MSAFTPVASLIGGGLIGLSASWLLLSHGRAAGISGLYGGIWERETEDWALRIWFVAGLCLAGLIARLVYPQALGESPMSLATVAIAGLLVGFGTRLGNGCTSGHGVCGLSRMSRRSLVAVATFMATGFATVYVVRHLVGGGR